MAGRVVDNIRTVTMGRVVKLARGTTSSHPCFLDVACPFLDRCVKGKVRYELPESVGMSGNRKNLSRIRSLLLHAA
jgi:hypothetical protein